MKAWNDRHDAWDWETSVLQPDGYLIVQRKVHIVPFTDEHHTLGPLFGKTSQSALNTTFSATTGRMLIDSPDGPRVFQWGLSERTQMWEAPLVVEHEACGMDESTVRREYLPHVEGEAIPTSSWRVVRKWKRVVHDKGDGSTV